MKATSNIQFGFCLKAIGCFLALALTSLSGLAQNVGISPSGAVAPNTAAGLDINFTTKGLLIPRVSLSSTSSFEPLAAHIAGMIVYNTANTADVFPGIYENDGLKWKSSTPKSSSIGDLLYWDGTSWASVPIGQTGQLLQVNALGRPTWGASDSVSLSTNAVSSITSTSASGGGVVYNDGGSQVTQYGTCWGTNANPMITDNFTVDGSGIGQFSSSISGLTAGTQYYVRSYAITSSGTTYGNQVSFTTAP